MEIGSNVNGRDLDADEFRPFFEAAEALGLAILIHGGKVAGGDRMGDYHFRNLVGFPVDTTLAAVRLIFLRLPRPLSPSADLHRPGWGLPPLRGWPFRSRLCGAAGVPPLHRPRTERLPAPALLRHHHAFARVLRLLLDTVGPQRVMLGSDFPFDMETPDPRSVVTAQADLSPSALSRMYGDTAREFLGLGEARGKNDVNVG